MGLLEKLKLIRNAENFVLLELRLEIIVKRGSINIDYKERSGENNVGTRETSR